MYRIALIGNNGKQEVKKMSKNNNSKIRNLSEGEKAFVERTYAEIIAFQFLKEKGKIFKTR